MKLATNSKGHIQAQSTKSILMQIVFKPRGTKRKISLKVGICSRSGTSLSQQLLEHCQRHPHSVCQTIHMCKALDFRAMLTG
jgi:hypothetical protein